MKYSFGCGLNLWGTQFWWKSWWSFGNKFKFRLRIKFFVNISLFHISKFAVVFLPYLCKWYCFWLSGVRCWLLPLLSIAFYGGTVNCLYDKILSFHDGVFLLAENLPMRPNINGEVFLFHRIGILNGSFFQHFII